MPTDAESSRNTRSLAPRLSLFDTTMLVMGGMVGSGIFMNPTFVARQVHTPALILGAWVFGGIVALIGAFIYAELSSRLPKVGGQYAYLREAFHPLVAFLYGWVLLLVVQTGGMAAVTVTFATYFVDLTGLNVPVSVVALIALVALTVANCLGVKSGSVLQSVLMLLKIAAIGALVFGGTWLVQVLHFSFKPMIGEPLTPGLISAFGAAMVPVLFAYGGWQTGCFVASELREPRRDLPRALLLGVTGVVVLYVAVNFACLRTLGASDLAATNTPASAVMQLVLGRPGSVIIALGITISTLGFLSQSVLTAPRVYFAMAQDGIFFRRLAWVHPRTRVPVFAIILQSAWTMLIVLSGSYGQILNYVTAMDWIFFGLTASCLFIFRRRVPSGRQFRLAFHPVSTAFFCAVSWSVVANAVYTYPHDTLIGIGILASGIPVYFVWSKLRPHG
ncbi:MAG TPA: amino acid permease [Chthoniobacterales bacterium]